MVPIGGWKTKLGAVIMVLSPVPSLFGLGPEYTDFMREVGTALLGVGIAHKVVKAANGGSK